MGTWVVMGLGLVALLATGLAVDGLSARLQPEMAWTNAMLMACVGGWALVVGLGMAASFVNWAVYELNAREDERRRSEAITPRVMEMQAAAALSPEQAKLVPLLENQAHLVMTAAEDGPMFSLECPGGLVPLQWAIDFLRDSGQTDLRPIRAFADGTHARMYARMVTDWCIQRKLALPDAGSNPARWLTEHSKARALQLLGADVVMD